MVRKVIASFLALSAMVSFVAEAAGKDDLIVTFAPSVLRAPPGGLWAMVSRHVIPTLTGVKPDPNRNCSGVYAWLCAFNDTSNTDLETRTSNQNWVFLGYVAPRYIVAADVDGDGRDELVARYESKDRTGTYIIRDIDSGTPRWERILKRPVNVLHADIDGNGRDELLFLSNKLPNLRARMDSGQKVLVKGGMPSLIDAGDIDGNGQDDLIANFPSRDGLFLRLNNKGWRRIAPKRPGTFWLADTDGDGLKNILAFFGPDEGIKVRDTRGQWRTFVTGLAATSVQFGDFDGNGRDDLVAYLNSQKGTYVRMDDGQWFKLRNGLTNIVAIGDIDDNGKDDIVFSSLNGSSVGATSTWAWMNNSQWAEVSSAEALGITDGTAIPCLGGSVPIQTFFAACGFIPNPGFTEATYTFADVDGTQRRR